MESDLGAEDDLPAGAMDAGSMPIVLLVRQVLRGGDDAQQLIH